MKKDQLVASVLFHLQKLRNMKMNNSGNQHLALLIQKTLLRMGIMKLVTNQANNAQTNLTQIFLSSSLKRKKEIEAKDNNNQIKRSQIPNKMGKKKILLILKISK